MSVEKELIIDKDIESLFERYYLIQLQWAFYQMGLKVLKDIKLDRREENE